MTDNTPDLDQFVSYPRHKTSHGAGPALFGSYPRHQKRFPFSWYPKRRQLFEALECPGDLYSAVSSFHEHR